MAPVARAIDNAVAPCGPAKIGSKIEVRNGIVPGVEMTCCRVDLADADVAAVTTARRHTAATAPQRSTIHADARRDVAVQRETLNRTAGNGSQPSGRLCRRR